MKAQKTLIKGFIIAGLTISFLTTPAFAKTLRMSSWLLPNSPHMTEVFVPWTKNIERVTNGRVKIRILKKIVGSVTAQYDAAQSGQVDIAYGNQSYTPGRFKQYSFVELPAGGNSAEATSVAYWRTYNRFFGNQGEMKDVKLLALFTHGPGSLFTARKPVTDLESNRGVKIRGGGVAASRVVDSLGMTSVQAPISKAAEMLTNGVVDGIMLCRSILPILGFAPYVDYQFRIDGGFYNVSYFVVMNKNTWDSLSRQDQDAIDSVSGEVFARAMGRVFDSEGRKADEIYRTKGIKTTFAEGSFKRHLKQEFLKYENEWIGSVKDSGVDGRWVIDSYRAEVRKIEDR